MISRNKIICILFFLLLSITLSPCFLYAGIFPYTDIDNIRAITAVAIDGRTGKILYAKNPTFRIPPASTTKLVTAMVVLDHIKPEDLNKKVKISSRVASVLSIPPILYKGEVYTIRNLLYLMLIRSSNQAAEALAEAIAGSEENFVKLMNEKVKELGLKNTHFSTACGLPAPDQYTTAYDMAIILYHALKYPLIRKIIHTRVAIIRSARGRVLVVRNTNHLLFDPKLKNYIIGGKTGYTRRAKHCLINSIEYNGTLIITSVLGSPTRHTLWKDSKELINFSKMVLAKKSPPILLLTAINTNILASTSIVNPYQFYKKIKRTRYRRHKRHHKHYIHSRRRRRSHH